MSKLRGMMTEHRDRQKRDKQTCLSYWYPKLQEIEVVTPETIIVHTNGDIMISLCDGVKPKGFDAFVGEITDACNELGYPVFLRTGFTSAKHDWENSCFVPSLDKIRRHIHRIVEYSFMVDFFGVPVDVWAVREYIPMVTGFNAFHGNMPINKERRFFIRNGVIECSHPYWPESAFDDYEQGLPVNWTDILADLNSVTTEELDFLTEQTLKVAEVFPEYWSVDWSLAKDGRWVLIDMARGEDSYHWPECQVNAGGAE